MSVCDVISGGDDARRGGSAVKSRLKKLVSSGEEESDSGYDSTRPRSAYCQLLSQLYTSAAPCWLWSVVEHVDLIF